MYNWESTIERIYDIESELSLLYVYVVHLCINN